MPSHIPESDFPIAEVVLLRRFDRVLHYSIPDSLKDSIVPGLRVLAPFRSAWRVGVVTRRLKSSEFTPLKPLVAAIDEAPLLDRPMMALTRWLSEYYVTGWGTAIKAVLPSGMDLKPGRAHRITEKGLESLSNPGPRTTRDQALLEALRASHSALSPARLKRRLLKSGGLPRGWEARLGSLIKRGLIEEKPVLPKTRSPSLKIKSPPAEANTNSIQTNPVESFPTKAGRELVADLQAGEFSVVCLEGHPRKARTAALEGIRAAVAADRTTIVLVPEIHRIPEWLGRMKGPAYGPVAVLHGGLSDRERRAAWERVRGGGAAVVLGTRLAVLAPLGRLGLVVVEDEADEAYKQEEAPRYHARDLAVLRASHAGALAVLTGTALSVETYANTLNGKYRSVPLEDGPEVPAPDIRVIDMSALSPGTLLSDDLLKAVAARLEKKEPSVLILNRRGYGTALFCRDCGFVLRCRRCQVAMVYSKGGKAARCHYCGLTIDPPEVCGQCRGTKLQVIGHGTEQAEELLKGRFPDARILRVDRETASAEEAAAAMRQLDEGGLDIVLGTQILIKSSAFSKPALAALLNADNSFHRPDFRAGEKAFQLTAQVRSLAGGGEVWIQTHHPAHHGIAWVVSGKKEEFYQMELAQRKAMSYPPFMRLAVVTVKALRESEADAAAQKFSEALRSAIPPGRSEELAVLGPAPAPQPRLREKFRRQILVKAAGPRLLQRSLSSALEAVRSGRGGPRVWYEVDVDPLRMT